MHSVVFAVPPSGVPKRSEAAKAMDMSPCKVDMTVEGAVGGQIEEDPNTHPMAWMRDHQNSYSDEDDPLLAFTPPTHGWWRDKYQVSCASFAVHLAMVSRHSDHGLPSRPKQHGDRALATPG